MENNNGAGGTGGASGGGDGFDSLPEWQKKRVEALKAVYTGVTIGLMGFTLTMRNPNITAAELDRELLKFAEIILAGLEATKVLKFGPPAEVTELPRRG